MEYAAYNSPICSHFRARCLRMFIPFPARFVGFVLLTLASLLSAATYAQNWDGVEAQLADKIVSVTGLKTMALEVVSRSSLGASTTDNIRRNLLTQLAVKGVRFAPTEQAALTVRVSLSEDLQGYVWVAEIRQGTNSPSIVMVSIPRLVGQTAEPPVSTMVLQRIPLWSQEDRILDVAVIDGNPARILVLDGESITAYRLQDSRWQQEQSLPIVHSRPWPRDLRGRLILAKGKDKDLSLEAYLPGLHCRGTAGTPPALTCYENDDPWPIGTDLSSLSASFASTRNFFTGALSPGVGKQTLAPAFYSAAAVPRDQAAAWLLATVGGQVHLLDGDSDQVLEKLSWGSDVASVRSGCGSGWQVLATGTGSGASDTVQAFELVGREAVAAATPLKVNGPITSMWSESSGSGAVAVEQNFETGRYEAFRLILTCGR